MHQITLFVVSESSDQYDAWLCESTESMRPTSCVDGSDHSVRPCKLKKGYAIFSEESGREADIIGGKIQILEYKYVNVRK